MQLRFHHLLVVTAIVVGCQQRSAEFSEEANNVTVAPVSDSAHPQVVPAAFNEAGAPTVELAVPGMMCEDGCARKVAELLADQPGALDVKVLYDEKKAIVAFDEAEFNGVQAVAVLVDHGFELAQLIGSEDLEPTAPDS